MTRSGNIKIALICYIMMTIMIEPMAVAVGHIKFNTIVTEDMQRQSSMTHQDHLSAHENRAVAKVMSHGDHQQSEMKNTDVSEGHCDDARSTCHAGSCCYVALTTLLAFRADISSYGFVGAITTHKNYIPLLTPRPPLQSL